MFIDVGSDIVDIFLDKQVVPNEVSKAILFANDLLKTGLGDTDTTMEFLRRHRVWTDQTLLKDTFQLMGWIVGINTDIMDEFVRAVEAAARISFESLSAEQKATLKGPAIGEAIDLMRREVIEEWVLTT